MFLRVEAARRGFFLLVWLLFLFPSPADAQLFGVAVSRAQLIPLPAEVLSCSSSMNVWQRVLRVRTARYCALLDQARANLFSRPALSLKWAQQVLQAFPALREAQLLRGAAQFNLGDAKQAHQIFSSLEAATSMSGALPIPVNYLWLSAQAAVHAGDFAVARSRYRRLLLSLSEFHFAEYRARVLIEAATISLYAGPEKSEARAYLERASEEEAPLLAPVLAGLWQGLGSYLKQETSAGITPELYFKASWLLGMEADGQAQAQSKAQAQTLVTLPEGARHLILAFLAQSLKLEQVILHLRELSCENMPFPDHLRQEFKKELTQVQCEVAGSDGFEQELDETIFDDASDAGR